MAARDSDMPWEGGAMMALSWVPRLWQRRQGDLGRGRQNQKKPILGAEVKMKIGRGPGL